MRASLATRRRRDGAALAHGDRHRHIERTCRHQRRDRLADSGSHIRLLPRIASDGNGLRERVAYVFRRAVAIFADERGGSMGCYRKPPQLVQPNLPRTGPQG